MKPFIPLYAYPTTVDGGLSESWQLLLAGHRTSHVVVNVANGPGDAADPNFVRGITAAARQTEALYGYVHLSYGNRLAAEILSDHRRWRSWYGLDHVFLDECPADEASIPELFDLIEKLRAQGATAVVANPGIAPADVLWQISDLVVTKELTADNYLALDLADEPLQTDRSIHLVHSCPPELLPDVNQRLTHVGYGLVTVHSLPHPWRDLGALDGTATATNP